MEQYGFLEQKYPIKSTATPKEREDHNRSKLSRALNTNTTVAFIGAGCSAPLSYPTWEEFARRIVDETIKALGRRRVKPEFEREFTSNLRRLKGFQKQLTPGKKRPYPFPFILSTCQTILTKKGSKAYYGFLEDQFRDGRNRKPTKGNNPYDELLALPIKRFITSNYDREIEKALEQQRADDVSAGELLLHREGGKSTKTTRVFTQKPEYYDQLALFALAHVGDAYNLVFHCHGHYKDLQSMVVTEKDYQQWYLAQTPQADAFRQTIALLFSSNPILFVGYGLGDDDLLRPLRMLTATMPDRKTLQPLFALLPERSKGAEQDYHEFLYDRYGLNVIPYVQEKTDQGLALCEALRRLHRDRETWWDEWLKKPKIRKVEMRAHRAEGGEPFCHYSIVPAKRSLKFKRAINDVLDLVPKHRVIAIIGPGGTGKSWVAHRLMQVLHRRKKRYDGYFFWSSYYANDWLTGLDRALSFMSALKVLGSRLDRFRACLHDESKRFFLVFDGIERLLRETKNAQKGSGISPGASSFLKLLANPGPSTVVITSRLWPEEFDPDEKTPPESRTQEELNTDEKTTQAIKTIKLVRLQELTKNDLASQVPFTWIEREVSGLCSLLDGHTYGLSIAAELLRATGTSKVQEKLTEIRRALTHTPPDRRVPRMIRVAMEEVDKNMAQDSRGLALKFMERLALFMSPVDMRTVGICYESATEDLLRERPHSKPLGRDRLLKDLIRRNLVQQVSTEIKGRDIIAYTMHPIVRGHIFQRVHHASTEALPDFTLPGFTVGSAVIDPGSKQQGVRVVSDIFNRLYEASKEAKAESKKATSKIQKNRKQEEAITLCRSAFGVVRSRMEVNTVPRWSSYYDYFDFILKVADLAKSVCDERVWAYADRHDAEAVEDESGPLYADELAWIYNEIGLTSYSEGTMLDAIAAWEQGYEINRAIDSYDEGGNYLFQSQCNLGAAYIHFGNLDIANQYLRQAQRTNHRLNDKDHGGRIAGYLGLVQHLRGDFKAANKLYEEAIEMLDGNARAASIFLRHHGDLKIRLEEIPQAKFLLQQSLSLAEANRYPELVAYARLSYGHLFRSEKKYPEALNEYNAALKAAREIGVRRLESEALSELSQLAFDLGDYQIARQRALEALRIANMSVLGLRQTHCLVVLGKATINADQRELGLAYLVHARKLAKHQGYWLRGREAEELLQRHGVDSSEREASA